MEIHHFIHLIHFSPNPIFLVTENKKDHSTWSYAFSMSSLHITASSLFFKTESKTSLATKTASRICLPCTKAFWALETTFPTTLFNLLAKTLANHLYRPPTKLIGLKSLKSSAPPFFGIKTIKVALRLLTNRDTQRIISTIRKSNFPFTFIYKQCNLKSDSLQWNGRKKLIETK